MAVDTADKRFSLIGLVSGVGRVLPAPDASFSSGGDRLQLAFLYRGIDALPLVVFILGYVTGNLTLRNLGGSVSAVGGFGGSAEELEP